MLRFQNILRQISFKSMRISEKFYLSTNSSPLLFCNIISIKKAFAI